MSPDFGRIAGALVLWRACRFIQFENNNVSRFASAKTANKTASGQSSYDLVIQRMFLDGF